MNVADKLHDVMEYDKINLLTNKKQIDFSRVNFIDERQ